MRGEDDVASWSPELDRCSSGRAGRVVVPPPPARTSTLDRDVPEEHPSISASSVSSTEKQILVPAVLAQSLTLEERSLAQSLTEMSLRCSVLAESLAEQSSLRACSSTLVVSIATQTDSGVADAEPTTDSGVLANFFRENERKIREARKLLGLSVDVSDASQDIELFMSRMLDAVLKTKSHAVDVGGEGVHPEPSHPAPGHLRAHRRTAASKAASRPMPPIREDYEYRGKAENRTTAALGAGPPSSKSSSSGSSSEDDLDEDRQSRSTIRAGDGSADGSEETEGFWGSRSAGNLGGTAVVQAARPDATTDAEFPIPGDAEFPLPERKPPAPAAAKPKPFLQKAAQKTIKVAGSSLGELARGPDLSAANLEQLEVRREGAATNYYPMISSKRFPNASIPRHVLHTYTYYYIQYHNIIQCPENWRDCFYSLLESVGKRLLGNIWRKLISSCPDSSRCGRFSVLSRRRTTTPAPSMP